MKNKDYGIGSVYYNKDRSNWIASYYIKDLESGKNNRVRKSFDTHEEAQRFLRILQYQKNNEIYIKNNSIPLFELMKLIQKRKLDSNQISIIAYNRLESTLKVIDKSYVVHKDINDINSNELQEYFNSLTFYSTSYIRKIIELFSQAFKYAMNKGFLLNNPMFDTIVPKSKREDKIVRALDIEEQKRLTEYLMYADDISEPYRLAYLLELYTGMRIGEAFALKKSDINLAKDVIYINRTITHGEDGRRVLGKTPKTKASIREVPIPKMLKTMLAEQMQMANGHKDDLLFVSSSGELVDPANANAIFKNRICKKLGIEDVTSHSLRHSFATRCIESGIPAVVVQKLLGHTDVGITLNVYTSVFNRYKESELEKVNDYYIDNDFFDNNQKMISDGRKPRGTMNSKER